MIQPNQMVSVILPVWNSAQYVRQAIQSVRDQQYDLIDIHVVDDGSTDNVREKIAECGSDIKYHYQENLGPAAARNSGIRFSQGELVAFLDADDIWPPGRLQKMLLEFDRRKELDVVMGHVETILDVTKIKNKLNPHLLKPHILPVFGCGLFKREVFDTVGLLDQSLRYSEDHDWFIRAKEKKVWIKILKSTTLKKRIHPGSMTEGVHWKDAGILKVLKKSLDRRRADDGYMKLARLSEFVEKD